jgi:hypothetical protein
MPRKMRPQIGATQSDNLQSKREPFMSRTKTYGLVLGLLASAALSTACTRTDATGPSDTPQASFNEAQGGNNGK